MSKKQSLIPKELSGIAKLVGTIQKALAKEFLALLVILILAFPVALLITYITAYFAPGHTNVVFDGLLSENSNDSAADGGKYSFIIIYIISAIGLYFVRMILGSIKVLVQKDKEE